MKDWTDEWDIEMRTIWTHIKRLILPAAIILMLAIVAGLALRGYAKASDDEFILAQHTKLLYPVARVNDAGSGTIIYSKLTDGDKYSTWVLTNHHVIEDKIKIEEEWDSYIQKNVKREKREIVYVEIFQYRDISTPVGTMKVEGKIEAYSKDGDMALIKLSTETQQPYVAVLCPKDNVDDLKVFDTSYAVGCSLGFPPIPTIGTITRLNFYISSLPYHMSSSQIIFGNSGGAMYDGQYRFIGIPSRVAVYGWASAATHMGLFIPIKQIYKWFDKEHLEFLYDGNKTETECLKAREEAISKKKKEEDK